jgi:hypothetical protein
MSQKMPLTITTRELHISDLKIMKRPKNVLIKPFNLIKSRLSHMPGWLTVKKNSATGKEQSNVMREPIS